MPVCVISCVRFVLHFLRRLIVTVNILLHKCKWWFKDHNLQGNNLYNVFVDNSFYTVNLIVHLQ